MFGIWGGTSFAGLWMEVLIVFQRRIISDVFLFQIYQFYQIRANPMTLFKCIYYQEGTISDTVVPRYPWGLVLGFPLNPRTFGCSNPLHKMVQFSQSWCKSFPMLETMSRLLIRSYANDMQIAVMDHSIDNSKKQDWECSERRQFSPIFPIHGWLNLQTERLLASPNKNSFKITNISWYSLCLESEGLFASGITLAASFNTVLVLPSTLRMLIWTMDIYLCVHLCMKSKEPTSFLPTWVSVADHLLNGQMANPRTPPVLHLLRDPSL